MIDTLIKCGGLQYVFEKKNVRVLFNEYRFCISLIPRIGQKCPDVIQLTMEQAEIVVNDASILITLMNNNNCDSGV